MFSTLEMNSVNGNGLSCWEAWRLNPRTCVKQLSNHDTVSFQITQHQKNVFVRRLMSYLKTKQERKKLHTACVSYLQRIPWRLEKTCRGRGSRSDHPAQFLLSD